MPPLPPLDKTFTDQQLMRIVEQAAIYLCACPAQLCKAINQQRDLFDYQASCLEETDIDRQVHRRIAEAARRSHAELETCLRDVLVLEAWDLDTLTMPPHLIKRLAEEMARPCRD